MFIIRPFKAPGRERLGDEDEVRRKAAQLLNPLEREVQVRRRKEMVRRLRNREFVVLRSYRPAVVPSLGILEPDGDHVVLVDPDQFAETVFIHDAARAGDEIEQTVEFHLVQLVGKRIGAGKVRIHHGLLVGDERNDDLDR